MKYVVVNLDPQLHPLGERVGRIFVDANAELIEKECASENDALDLAGDADALIAARAPVTRAVIENLTNCKVIARPGAGTGNVDHQAATEHNIVVVYVPDFSTEEVSNHALMFILTCNKKLLILDKSVRDGNWGVGQVGPISAIRGQVFGVVGFGRIAQSLSKKAQSLGMIVLAHDPYIFSEVYEKCNVKERNLQQILQESDYVSLHTPLTKETENLIGSEELTLMKSTAYLINCARGPVVDEGALIEALKAKEIAGAGLDCLAPEPPQKDNPLFDMDNVILTPHSAAYSDGAIDYLRVKTAQQIVQVLQGQKPDFIRNPEVLDKIRLL